MLENLKDFFAVSNEEITKVHEVIDKLADEFSELAIIEIQDLIDISYKQNEDSYAFIKSATPYYLAVSKILDDIYNDFEVGDNRNRAIIIINSAFNGTYLCSRLSPLVPELQRNITTDDDVIRLFDDLANKLFLNALFKERDKNDVAPNTNKKGIQKKDDIKKNIVAIKPTKAVSPVDKATRSIFNPEKTPLFYDGGLDLNVGHKGNKIVKVGVSLEIVEQENIRISKNAMLNPFDSAVHNAIIALYLAGNREITIAAIYRTIKGLTEDDSRELPGKETYERIKQSVCHLISNIITIDATQETEAYGYKELNFRGQIVPAQFFTGKINGKEVVDCLKILTTPPLYLYANGKNQVISYDIKMLNMPLNSTEENVILRNYLLTEIQIMKNKKSNRNNIFLYTTIYKFLKLEDAPKQKHAEIRKKCRTLLNNWKKMDLFKDYKELKDGKNIAKIEVIF